MCSSFNKQIGTARQASSSGLCARVESSTTCVFEISLKLG